MEAVIGAMTYTLCIHHQKNCSSSEYCHMLISGVGVKIASDILCESDGCHCKLPVSRSNDM